MFFIAISVYFCGITPPVLLTPCHASSTLCVLSLVSKLLMSIRCFFFFLDLIQNSKSKHESDTPAQLLARPNAQLHRKCKTKSTVGIDTGDGLRGMMRTQRERVLHGRVLEVEDGDVKVGKIDWGKLNCDYYMGYVLVPTASELALTTVRGY